MAETNTTWLSNYPPIRNKENKSRKKKVVLLADYLFIPEVLSLLKYFSHLLCWAALKTSLSPTKRPVSLPYNHTEYFRSLATLLFSFVFLFPVLFLMCCSSPQARRVLGSVGLKVQGKANGHGEPIRERKLAWFTRP